MAAAACSLCDVTGCSKEKEGEEIAVLEFRTTVAGLVAMVPKNTGIKCFLVSCLIEITLPTGSATAGSYAVLVSSPSLAEPRRGRAAALKFTDRPVPIFHKK